MQEIADSVMQFSSGSDMNFLSFSTSTKNKMYLKPFHAKL